MSTCGNPGGLRHWSEYPGRPDLDGISWTIIDQSGHDRRIGYAEALRRQAEDNGANRTAGPDHEDGPSDPMIPKAVIRTDHFAE